MCAKESELTVILADGAFPTGKEALEYLDRACRVICCDGAARSLVAYGREPDRIVGDLDSLSEEFKKRFSDRIEHVSEQESNDLSNAASNMQEGSAGQTAVQVGGGAIAGALQGAVAGPLGALAGGIMGLTTELISANAKAREAERARRDAIIATCDANREQLEALWAAEERTSKFKDTLKALGNIEDENTRKAEILKLIEEKKRDIGHKDSELLGATDHFWGGKDGGVKFKKLMGERQTLTGELEQLQSLIEGFDKPKENGPAFRVSETATDALSRIGGNFGGERIDEQMLDTAIKTLESMKNIEKNTKKGGSSWQ